MSREGTGAICSGVRFGFCSNIHVITDAIEEPWARILVGS